MVRDRRKVRLLMGNTQEYLLRYHKWYAVQWRPAHYHEWHDIYTGLYQQIATEKFDKLLQGQDEGEARWLRVGPPPQHLEIEIYGYRKVGS
jgi:hypothetical protein